MWQIDCYFECLVKLNSTSVVYKKIFFSIFYRINEDESKSLIEVIVVFKFYFIKPWVLFYGKTMHEIL